MEIVTLIRNLLAESLGILTNRQKSVTISLFKSITFGGNSMYKHCNTEESARRQRQFEYSLLEMMRITPYAQITIGDLCEEVGLSRKSFYRYFGSKEGCLYALIDHSIMEFSSHHLLEDLNRESRTALYEHYFIYWKQMEPLLEALCQNHLVNCLFERNMLCITQEEHELFNYLRQNSHDDAYEQVLFLVSGITGILINWHSTGYKKSAAQMAVTMERLISNSFPESST